MELRRKACYIVGKWDDEAQVWVAQSNDVPGLCIEAATQADLVARLKVVVPELLELNSTDSECVLVELLLRGQSQIDMAC